MKFVKKVDIGKENKEENEIDDDKYKLYYIEIDSDEVFTYNLVYDRIAQINVMDPRNIGRTSISTKLILVNKNTGSTEFFTIITSINQTGNKLSEIKNYRIYGTKNIIKTLIEVLNPGINYTTNIT